MAYWVQMGPGQGPIWAQGPGPPECYEFFSTDIPSQDFWDMSHLGKGSFRLFSQALLTVSDRNLAGGIWIPTSKQNEN